MVAGIEGVGVADLVDEVEVRVDELLVTRDVVVDSTVLELLGRGTWYTFIP